MAQPAQRNGPDQRAAGDEPSSRGAELVSFLILAVVIWPLIAVAVVGGYGFLVWMSQLVFGPPGPPG